MGKVAGVTIRQAAEAERRETVIQIRNPMSVRNDGAPTYIVDGVIMIGGMQPGSIDASRIESIEVVQGQQAISLYGTNVGANGVIVIKTKKQ
jgi:TonB-dependent SusC/RagA subfamily outer membrane receptor